MDAQTFIALLCALFVVEAQLDSTAMDFVLLMDSSDNFRSLNFEKEKAFALELLNQLYGRNTQISLITFGENPYSQFTLDAYSDIQQMREAVKYMWYSTGDGNVAPSIEYAINNGFDKASGARECIPHTLVIVTHTGISNSEALKLKRVAESKLVRSIVLNMAGANAEPNFVTLANDSSRVIGISDYAALQSSLTTVVNKVKTDIPRTGCGKFSDWSNWTTCSVSCDRGLRFRTRSCNKDEPTDKDCEGQFSDETLCVMTDCTEPIDGTWSDWGSWQTCSKTCESGIQTRTRFCDRPPPRNGGKTCPGASRQERNCNEWKCPDCYKTCPAGSHLSRDCHVCECSSVTIFGQLLDNTQHPVEEADIYLESSRYKPIAHTDRFGIFSKLGVCMLNERIFIQAPKCEAKHFIPMELNATHWTIANSTMMRLAAPVIMTQPHEKVRMVGQSFTLCCSAFGYPEPQSYKWFKNGIEMENVGQNGSLTVRSATKLDAGHYNCYTETAAGVTLSEVVNIKIEDSREDTCSAPTAKLQELPSGCFLTGDITKNNTIDIGDCGKALCMRSSLHDNGSCSDYWPHHCCNPKDVDVLDITCRGFSYQTTRVRSCECKPCIFKTVISGRAVGRSNGTDIPFKIGQVIVDAKVISTTNAAGFFSFEVPKGNTRVVATFHDNIFKKFLDITKIVQVKEGTETVVSIVVPLRPTPIIFHAENGTEIHLGTNGDLPAAGRLSIPADSVVTTDGKPYNGSAKTTIHFMDPRNKDDIEAANGDFVSETPGGEKMPLKTFGMFQLGVEDNKGNQLKINKPMKFSLDSSLFNVPLDEKGDPDLSLWNYDKNKGIWVETAKMKLEKISQRRKLLASGFFVAEVDPKGIPSVNQYTTKTVSVFTGEYTNCDHSVPIFTNITQTVPKDGACFVSVSVYKDLSLREAYDASDIEIKTYVKELDGSSYIGFHSQSTLSSGHACIPVFCDKLVEMYVVRSGKERLLAGNHYLPHPGYVIKTIDNAVHFESRDYGISLDCSGPFFKPGSTCRGPMYQLVDTNKCTRESHNSNGFQFKFAPFTKAPSKNFVAGEGKYDEKLSWYPFQPSLNTQYKSCFLKVRIDVKGIFDLRIVGKSNLKSINGESFGSYEVGPTPDPRTDNLDTRGACIEFRCPGYLKDGGKEIFDQDTVVDVHINTANTALNCTINKTNPLITVTPNYDAKNPQRGVTGFQFVAQANINYGSQYGIFINDNPSSEVDKFCASGWDRGPHVDGLMDPKVNTAVEIVCA